MAKVKTYIATAPDGSQHKRTTQSRTYTHAVIGRRSYDRQLASANDKGWKRRDGENWDYYTALAAGTHEHCGFKSTTDNDRAAWAEFAAQNPDRATYIQAQHASRVAEVEARKAAGYYEEWHAITWCGRPDLVGKQIASNAEWWVDIQAVPAILKGEK